MVSQTFLQHWESHFVCSNALTADWHEQKSCFDLFPNSYCSIFNFNNFNLLQLKGYPINLVLRFHTVGGQIKKRKVKIDAAEAHTSWAPETLEPRFPKGYFFQNLDNSFETQRRHRRVVLLNWALCVKWVEFSFHVCSVTLFWFELSICLKGRISSMTCSCFFLSVKHLLCSYFHCAFHSNSCLRSL